MKKNKDNMTVFRKTQLKLNPNQPDLVPHHGLKEVIVSFKTHFDIGYTNFAEVVERHYGTTMLEGALENLDQGKHLSRDKQFVWTLPGWPMKQILERCSDENRKRAIDGLKEKSFVTHALPFTCETESSDLENLVRGLNFSAEISRKYGLELSRDAKLTDVPSHSWLIPTLLKHAGIDFLHLGCNPGSSSPDVPDIFWWEGPDGSRLLTMYSKEFYGTDLVAPPDWPFKTWLALIPTGDNKGAPPQRDVEITLNQIKKLAPNARIKTGRLSDFFDAFIKENPELPVVKGDMPDTWIHGTMSMPAEVKVARQVRRDLYTLESINTQLNLWTGKSIDISPLVKKASENSILFDEHTFGMAMNKGQTGHWAYGDQFKTLRTKNLYNPIEKSWNEKGQRIYQAYHKVNPNFNSELQRLADAVAVKVPHLTVYNPLPWTRSGMVTAQVLSENIQGHTLEDQQTGERINFTNSGNITQFKAKDVPALGYKTYVPIEKKSKLSENTLYIDETNYTIENNFFKVILNPKKGKIDSIFDKKRGVEMVNQNGEYGFGNYFYEKFGREDTESYVKKYSPPHSYHWTSTEMGRPFLKDSDTYTNKMGGVAQLSFEKDELRASAIMHFSREDGNLHDYSIIITLYRESEHIELNWAIHSKPAEPMPEAGWIPFCFNIENPSFKVGRIGAVVDPATDFIKGSNTDYYFANTGVALLNQQGDGFGISSPDVPAISLDRPGLWKYSEKFIPKKSNVLFNLYNNLWSTNFIEWIEGSWNVRFHLWSITDYNNENDLISPSEEFRLPLQVAFSAEGIGTLPAFKKGLSLSKKGVVLTCFGPSVQGDGYQLRLWEQAGESGECTVNLPDGLRITRALPVNLRSEPIGEPLKISNEGTFSIYLEAYKPYSFLLQ